MTVLTAPQPPVFRPAAPVRPVRRPARVRPGGRGVSYAGLPAPVRTSRAPHAVPTPAAVHRRRRVIAGAAVGLLVGLSLLGLVSLRQAGTPQVPAATAVVQVQAGESLSELALRVAPRAPSAAVVERIRSLNGLAGASVRTGESLVVPIG